MSSIYRHINLCVRTTIRLIVFFCLFLAPAAGADFGFQADFDPIASWVSPYDEPDYRFSAALYPKSYPMLSNDLMLSPSVI
ncbi:MAG: hypothetical protein ACREBV_05850, partial [Candidatus Zixiibacteriota bacterium]